MNEIAADAREPTKEFFQIVVESLFEIDDFVGFFLFTGERRHYVPLCNLDATISGCFLIVGKLLAHSILHGGPWIPGLVPAIAKYLMTGSVAESENFVEVEVSQTLN